MFADNATLNSGGHIFYDLAPLPVLDPIYLQTSHLLHHTSDSYFKRHITDIIQLNKRV